MSTFSHVFFAQILDSRGKCFWFSSGYKVWNVAKFSGNFLDIPIAHFIRHFAKPLPTWNANAQILLREPCCRCWVRNNRYFAAIWKDSGATHIVPIIDSSTYLVVFSCCFITHWLFCKHCASHFILFFALFSLVDNDLQNHVFPFVSLIPRSNSAESPEQFHFFKVEISDNLSFAFWFLVVLIWTKAVFRNPKRLIVERVTVLGFRGGFGSIVPLSYAK